VSIAPLPCSVSELIDRGTSEFLFPFRKGSSFAGNANLFLILTTETKTSLIPPEVKSQNTKGDFFNIGIGGYLRCISWLPRIRIVVT